MRVGGLDKRRPSGNPFFSWNCFLREGKLVLTISAGSQSFQPEENTVKYIFLKRRLLERRHGARDDESWNSLAGRFYGSPPLWIEYGHRVQFVCRRLARFHDFMNLPKTFRNFTTPIKRETMYQSCTQLFSEFFWYWFLGVLFGHSIPIVRI